MPKTVLHSIRSTKGDVFFSTPGLVARGSSGGLEMHVVFKDEPPQAALLYLTLEKQEGEKLECLKLMKGGRTYRFMHRGDTITLILPSNGGIEIRLEKRSVELVRDIEEQLKIIQEYNLKEREPARVSRQEDKEPKKTEKPVQTAQVLSLPAPHRKSTAEQGAE